GISVKKSLRTAEQDRADVARARRRWIRQQGLFDASSLVFIDETSVNTSMARLRSMPAGRAIDRAHAVWNLGDADLRGWPALRRNDGAPGDRRRHERRNLSVLRRAMPGSRAQPRRYRRDGQPQSPQGCWRRGSDRGRWCRSATSAQVLARSQSQRDVLQQAQVVSAQSCRADAAQPSPPNRPLRASPRRGRMLQLLRSCRIRLNMSGIRFSNADTNWILSV